MKYIVNNSESDLSSIKSYLFELESPLKLLREISDIPKGSLDQTVKLTSLKSLSKAVLFDEIDFVYKVCNE